MAGCCKSAVRHETGNIRTGPWGMHIIIVLSLVWDIVGRATGIWYRWFARSGTWVKRDCHTSSGATVRDMREFLTLRGGELRTIRRWSRPQGSGPVTIEVGWKGRESFPGTYYVRRVVRKAETTCNNSLVSTLRALALWDQPYSSWTTLLSLLFLMLPRSSSFWPYSGFSSSSTMHVKRRCFYNHSPEKENTTDLVGVTYVPNSKVISLEI